MRRLIRSKWFILGLVVVILLSLAALSASLKNGTGFFENLITVPLTPLQNAIAFLSGKIGGFFAYFEDVKITKAQNEELNRRISELEQEILHIRQLEKENQELRDALKLKDQYDEYEFIGSSIIAKDPGNWFEIFTINCGSKDGIDVDSPVITAYGLVGRVCETDLLSSRVISLIDLDSTVSARFSNSRDTIIVRGDVNLKSKGLCRADYISPEMDIKPGDIVETSGLGGIFPKGIIIGKVEQIVRNEGQYDSYAIIRPIVDFKRLEEVIVLDKKQ